MFGVKLYRAKKIELGHIANGEENSFLRRGKQSILIPPPGKNNFDDD